MACRAVQRSKVRPGKIAEAMEIAREAHVIIMRHGCKSNRVFMVEVGGSSTGEVHAEMEFDSMEDWASWRGKFNSDPEMQALRARVIDVFEPESLELVVMNEWDLS